MLLFSRPWPDVAGWGGGISTVEGPTSGPGLPARVRPRQWRAAPVCSVGADVGIPSAEAKHTDEHPRQPEPPPPFHPKYR